MPPARIHLLEAVELSNSSVEFVPDDVPAMLDREVNMGLNEQQIEFCETSRWDFSDLRALLLNCTLKKSPELSHTEALLPVSQTIMERNGVTTEMLRPVDFNIASGVYPDMTARGWEVDDWPDINEEGDGRRHSCAGNAHLAGRKVVDLHSGD